MTEEEKRLVLQFEDEENFREFYRAMNQGVFIHETKRENGFTYWDMGSSGNYYTVFKSKEEFNLSFEIDQMPKTKASLVKLKVKVFAMTREEFVKFIYE
jgi:hypothetical protein